MARGGKLTKLKSVLKKWNSFGNNSSKHSRPDLIKAVTDDHDASAFPSSSDLIPVYVGKSWRRYLVTPVLVDHPLFRELVGRSRDSEEGDTIHVACEVLLFEHLLWMLENADPQPESFGRTRVLCLLVHRSPSPAE